MAKPTSVDHRLLELHHDLVRRRQHRPLLLQGRPGDLGWRALLAGALEGVRRAAPVRQNRG
jgi:hypothetical protein